MAIKELLNELHELDIKLWVEEDELHFRSPKGALTPPLRTQLRDNKTELVAFLQQAQNRRQPVTVQPVAIRPTHIPLAPAQEWMWILEQLGLHSAYNIPMALTIQGELQIDALVQTLTELVRRHEILRTTVTIDTDAFEGSSFEKNAFERDNNNRLANGRQNGAVYQVIHDVPTVDLPIVDLRSLAGDEQQAIEVQQRFEQEIARPFDLTQDLMCRATLFHLAEKEYLLLLIVHHFASDGWSQSVMLQEAAALYRAFAEGKPSPLPPLPIQYADFALHQRAQLTESWIEDELTYWRDRLAGAPQQLQLTTDRPRPQLPSHEGYTYRFVIEADLVQELRRLSRQAESTLFTTLLTAFQVLLARYTGEDDIVVGTISDNRNYPEIEPLIGLFINTLLLRADLAGDPSFWALLAQAKSTTEEAYSHQQLPFGYVVDALQSERSLAYHPLAQVFFRLRRQPTADFDLPNVEVSLFDFDFKRKGLPDLDLMLQETDQEINGYCFYNSDLFEATTIERLIAHFKTLLTAIIANPEQSIHTLPLLTAAERQQLLVTWNETENRASAWPDDNDTATCVHQLFERQVVRTPQAPALFDGGETPVSLTYAELNRRANQLAHYLRQCGVVPGTLVGICMDRSSTMIIALLATLKAGGAYIPLDPAYPHERLALMIEDSQLNILLTDGNSPTIQKKEPAHTIAPRTIVLADKWAAIQEQPEHNPAVAVGPDNLVYAIYTSGSTGQPKGAAVYHRGFTNLLHWYVNKLGMTAADRLMLMTALSFDLTQKNLFAPLLCGGSLYLSETLFDPVALCRAIEQHAITWVNCTPSMFAFLVEADLRNKRSQLASLRTVVLGGEPIAMHQFTQWLARPETAITLVNSYGPTECTDVCAAFVMETPATFGENTVPIGRPIPHVQLYVLDAHEEPVPVGHIGELCIAGVGVGAGYLHRAAQTDETFIPNPFAPDAGRPSNRAPWQRLYKTGDLVRYLPDGNLKFVGRNDHQVKVRGFRIELGEIEALLARHAAVSAAAVVVHEDQPGHQSLVAYVVTDGDELPAAGCMAELRTFLSDRVPDYMVPTHFVPMATLPLTLSGKVDRNALPAPDQPPQSIVAEPSMPPAIAEDKTPEHSVPPTVDMLLQQKISAAWKQILGQNEIGATDNFFARGGDSFLAIRCVALLTEWGLPLTLRDLFAIPTVAGLAERLQTRWSPDELNAFYAQQMAETQRGVGQHREPADRVNGQAPTVVLTSDPPPQPLQEKSPLVPIQPHGTKPPFFCMHPVMGGIHPYYTLAHLLGEDQPFYGLQAVGSARHQSEQSKSDQNTIEAIAARYIRAIRAVQPTGPYALGGWSFGGWVAFEMAQQLLAQGDSVQALIIIDTPALQQKRTLWDHLRSFWGFTNILGQYIWPYVSDYDTLSIAMTDFMEDEDDVASEMSLTKANGAQPSRLTLLRHPAMRRGWRMFMAHNRATLAYAPRSYPGQITVLRAAKQPNYDIMDLGWGKFAEKGVEIKAISGDHMTVLRQPHVQTVAECIRTVLASHAERQADAIVQRNRTVNEHCLNDSVNQIATASTGSASAGAEFTNGQTSQTLHHSTVQAAPVQPVQVQATQPKTVQEQRAQPPNQRLHHPPLSNGNGSSAHKQSGSSAHKQSGPSSKQSKTPTTRPAVATTSAQASNRHRPQNGQEYLNSLRDGREVWIYGKRVADVTAHPAFRNQSRMIARLYDALHDPNQQAVLTCATDFSSGESSSGGYTHPFFRASRTVEELTNARDALAAWHRIGYGWMGRGPDYMAGALGMLGPNAEFYAPYQANAQRWYQQFQAEMPYVCHAISNPPVDRHRPPDEVEDVYIHVVKESDAGIVVSGAKNITTNSALSQYAFVGQDGGAHVRAKSFATTFLVPMNTPGIKIICRPSYEMTAGVMGTPFDYPLSSRLDENDAILIFDEVLVPWENILVYGDLEKQNQHIARTGFFPRSGLQSSTRLAVKFDLIAGLLLKAVEATGVSEFRGVQVNVGEVLTWRHLFWGLSDAMANTAVEHNGAVVPKIEHMMAHRMLMSVAYPRIKELTSQLVASGLIFQPSSAFDFKTPELRPYLEKYVRGAAGDAQERVKLMKTLWDAIGTEFAGRHELYERNNLGNHEAVRLHALFHSIGTGTEDALKQFAETCMAEVDLDGWTAPDLINPDDLHGFHQWLG